MAFDLASAVAQGRTGQVPPGWDLFPVKAGKVITSGLSFVVVGLFMLGASVWMFISGTVIIPKFLPDSVVSGTPGFVLGLLEMLIVAAIGVGLLVAAVRAFRAASSASDHFLLFTPDGFAHVYGKRIQGAGYTDVTNLRSETNNTGLVVSARGQKPITIALTPFGKHSELQAILLGNVRRAQQQGNG
jgi:hypothetical protein